MKSVTGRIAYFTFNKVGIPDKYFWVDPPEGKGFFCKGRQIPGKELTAGLMLQLTGDWKINQNPKYRYIGPQFYFTSYEIISSEGYVFYSRLIS